MTAPGPEGLADEDPEVGRLRQLLWFDLATTCVGVVVIGSTYLLVAANNWLVVLGVFVACSGAVIATGLYTLTHHRLEASVALLSAANWSMALFASAIATFVWPLMVLAALLPAVIAAPYIPARHLRRYVVISLTVAIAVVALGVLQDFSGLSDDVPTWLPRTLLVFFVPFLAGMLLMTALQNQSRLQAALVRTLHVNEELAASRARVVAATDRARRRVERDLHDGAQQQLVAVGLRLRIAEDLCRSDQGGPEAAAAVAEARREVRQASQELRELAQGVFPSVLAQRGLTDALVAAADRCVLPVRTEIGVLGRCRREIESAVYFCCAEALQNAAKHAGSAATVTVTAARCDDRIVFVVADDGEGFCLADHSGGGGLDNLADRIGAAGGMLQIESSLGSGTVVSGSIPLS